MRAQRPNLYILDGQTPVPIWDTLEWGLWLQEGGERRVRQEWLGPFWVSTVFLGIDYGFSWDEDAPPIVFETMAFFCGLEAFARDRCATWEEAEAMHVEVLGKCYRALCRPWVLLPLILPTIEAWMWRWDRAFCGRYGKLPFAWMESGQDD